MSGEITLGGSSYYGSEESSLYNEGVVSLDHIQFDDLDSSSDFEVYSQGQSSSASLLFSEGGSTIDTASLYRSSVDVAFLTGHQKKVSCMKKISAEKILSLSDDRTAKIWDLYSRKCIKSFYFQNEALSSSVVDEFLLVGTRGEKVHIYERNTFEYCGNVSENRNKFSGFNSLVSLGNNLFASGSCQKPSEINRPWSYAIKIWNLNDRRYSKQLRDHSAAIRDLVYLQDTHFLSASNDSTIKIWNYVLSNNAIASLEGHQGPVQALCKSGDQDVYSGGSDGQLFQWDLIRAMQTRKFTDDADSGCAHQLAINGIANIRTHLFGSCSSDGLIKLWDSRVVNSVGFLNPNRGSVDAICPLNKGVIVASTSGKGQEGDIAVWDFRR